MCGDQKNRQLGKKFKGSKEIFLGAAVLTGHSLAGEIRASRSSRTGSGVVCEASSTGARQPIAR
jgi:hypothetical protein